jgi:molybdopterin/thiamine biosynthesis adenylyltransferase
LSDIETLLGQRGTEDQTSYRVELLDPKRLEHEQRLRALLSSGARVADTLVDQLAELVQTRSPAATLSAAEVDARVRAHLGGPAWAYGAWAHYPWDTRLVHVLPEAEHIELRTDRNRHKITADEQARLRRLRIGVIGLSTGQAVALTLVQEGIGGLFRLADFDRLSLSNLNRVRGGVHQLGLSKTVMAARAIAEIDPYVTVEILPGGFTADSADTFFSGDAGSEPLDVVVEVCDSIDIKALARIHARRRGVPVLMVNSEGGVLDIERFDRDPDRPIFHGLAPPAIDPASLAGADLDTKVAFLLPIVGLDHLSDRMIASLIEAGSTVSTWPQLASGVALGGALATSALRRLTLGQLRDSGRFALDLDSLVADGRGERAEVPAADAEPPSHGPAEETGPADRLRPALRAIAEAALAAPTGGNAQHCRFVLDGPCLEIHRREAALVPAFDPDNDSAWIAAGAAAENAALAATERGLVAAIEVEPRGDPQLPLVRIRLAAGPVEPDPLAEFIHRRSTNRRRSAPDPLDRGDVDALRTAAAERGADLEIASDPARRALLAQLIGAAERLRLLSAPMRSDLAAELRWTAGDVERTRDGIDVRALELRPGELASLRMMFRPGAMEFLRAIRGGERIGRIAGDRVAPAPAVAMLTCAGTGPEAFVRGGRAVERMWLRATERNLALAPATSLLFLMRLVERDCSPLDAGERAALLELRGAFDDAFPRLPGHTHVFLCRLGRADPPTVRSVRHPLEEMLEIR